MIDNNLADHSSHEASWTQECAQDTGSAESRVIEIIQWYQERFGSGGGSGGSGNVAISKVFQWILKKQATLLAAKAAAYALGLDEEINFKRPSDIARDHGCARENVRKMVDDFQQFMNLPARKEQRAPESRAKMAQKRRGQLEPVVSENYTGVCMTLGSKS
jgi:transposase-like protein